MIFPRGSCDGLVSPFQIRLCSAYGGNTASRVDRALSNCKRGPWVKRWKHGLYRRSRGYGGGDLVDSFRSKVDWTSYRFSCMRPDTK